MTHLISAAASGIGNYAYYLRYGYELSATKENLDWAIKQPEKEMLKYTFKEGNCSYSILEFAVGSNDLPSVGILAQCGADMNFSEKVHGHLTFFYMKCLKENSPPNLAILTILLSKMYINTRETLYFRTSLEFALEVMVSFKKIHWDVVETLLAKGAQISRGPFTSPFTILQKSYREKIEGQSLEAERLYFEKLICYLELEKKYHPNSTSSLTLGEFKCRTPMSRSTFKLKVEQLKILTAVRLRALKTMENLQLGEERSPEVALLFKFAEEERQEACQQSEGLSADLYWILFRYCKYFKALVKEGNVKDALASWQISDLQSYLKQFPEDLMVPKFSNLFRDYDLREQEAL